MPSCAAIHHGSGGGTSSQRPINREGNTKSITITHTLYRVPIIIIGLFQELSVL